MANLTKNSTAPKLDYVDQSTGSTVMTFVTKCEQRIDVEEAMVLDFIERAGLNVTTECSGPYWDPSTTEEAVETDAAKYLDDNFEYVTELYFDKVLVNLREQAQMFIKGYRSGALAMGRGVDAERLLDHVQREYGIRLEVA